MQNQMIQRINATHWVTIFVKEYTTACYSDISQSMVTTVT